MNFVKERNLIVVYDGVLKQGSWNITNGTFLGKSGKPVKNVPSCFTFKNLPERYDRRFSDEVMFGYAIRCYREWVNSWNFDYTIARGNRMEQLISVGLLPNHERDLDSNDALTKDLVTYLKENNRGYFDRAAVSNYLAEKKYQEFLNGKPDYIKNIFKTLITELPYDYLKTMLNRIEHEHVNSYFGNYNNSSLVNLIRRYYEICMQLYGSVEIKPNILSNYAHLLYFENEYKNTHYNEELNKYNNKEWLYYQNETFVVRPLLTKDEFHEEGERQNNCVERMYMERVHDGKTHVVTVRRIDNPTKNYITCEVSNNGRIVQYLIKNNRTPVDRDAIDFKRLYQEHLNTMDKN